MSVHIDDIKIKKYQQHHHLVWSRVVSKVRSYNRIRKIWERFLLGFGVFQKLKTEIFFPPWHKQFQIKIESIKLRIETKCAWISCADSFLKWMNLRQIFLATLDFTNSTYCRETSSWWHRDLCASFQKDILNIDVMRTVMLFAVNCA